MIANAPTPLGAIAVAESDIRPGRVGSDSARLASVPTVADGCEAHHVEGAIEAWSGSKTLGHGGGPPPVREILALSQAEGSDIS